VMHNLAKNYNRRYYRIIAANNLRYYFKVAIIRLDCRRKLVCLWLAVRLLKLAFKLSPALKKQLGIK
jgi:hypothetical protein